MPSLCDNKVLPLSRYDVQASPPAPPQHASLDINNQTATARIGPNFQQHLTSPLLFSLLAFLLTYLYFSPAHLPRPATMTTWSQKTFTLPARSRGSYLITNEIQTHLAPLISPLKIGLVHLFIQHTSCALSLNENWDSDVQADMSDALERIVPYDKGGRQGLYRHSAEGDDDMPAHVKSSLVGASVSIPVREGKMALGTWQGIWYLEFRRAKHTRTVVATVQGTTE